MKKLSILLMIGFASIITSNKSQAQVSIQLNIGTPVYWAPVSYERTVYRPYVVTRYYTPARRNSYVPVPYIRREVRVPVKVSRPVYKISTGHHSGPQHFAKKKKYKNYKKGQGHKRH